MSLCAACYSRWRQSGFTPLLFHRTCSRAPPGCCWCWQWTALSTISVSKFRTEFHGTVDAGTCFEGDFSADAHSAGFQIFHEVWSFFNTIFIRHIVCHPGCVRTPHFENSSHSMSSHRLPHCWQDLRCDFVHRGPTERLFSLSKQITIWTSRHLW